MSIRTCRSIAWSANSNRSAIRAGTLCFKCCFPLHLRHRPLNWVGRLANFEVDSGAAKVDLQLQLYDRSDGIFARFTYNTEIFDAATIRRMAGHFQTCCRASSPIPISAFRDCRSSAQAERISCWWNGIARQRTIPGIGVFISCSSCKWSELRTRPRWCLRTSA